ncbi:uncharacterized protein LOC144181533 [Stigmatopora nigra]
MVEQTRQPRRTVVISLTPQAGPGDNMAGHMLDTALRSSSQRARVVGRQLASIGDELDRIRTKNRQMWDWRQWRPMWIERGAFWASALRARSCGDLTGGAFLMVAFFILGWSYKPLAGLLA